MGSEASAARTVGRQGLRGLLPFRGASFHAPTAGGGGSGGTPARRRAGYLKRGESFRHSSKSTVIFILPPPRLAGSARRAEGPAGAAALETQTASVDSRPRLTVRGAAEGASPAGHSIREDSDRSSGPSPAPLPPAPSRALASGIWPGSDSHGQPATNPAANGRGFRQHRLRALGQRA